MVRRHPVVVVGVGNDLMGDDGVGPAVVRRLSTRWAGHQQVRLHVMEGDLLELQDLAAAASSLVVVDAALDVPVGAVRRRERPVPSGPAVSQHQADVVTTLLMLEALAPPQGFPPWQLWSIGITAPRELTVTMTPTATRATRRAAKLLDCVLEDLVGPAHPA